jgi:hypothetical protein
MSRPLGAKNKPKVVMVKLADLVKNLNSDMDIPVEIAFAQKGLVSQAKAEYVPAVVTPAALIVNITETPASGEPIATPTITVEEDNSAPIAAVETLQEATVTA